MTRIRRLSLSLSYFKCTSGIKTLYKFQVAPTTLSAITVLSVLTLHPQLPSVLDVGFRQLRILGTAHQELPLVLHRRREMQQTHAVLQLRMAIIRLRCYFRMLIRANPPPTPSTAAVGPAGARFAPRLITAGIA